MRIVTKQELLELPPYTFARECPNGDFRGVSDEVIIKTGTDFGAFSLLQGFHVNEDVLETWDWDGNVDVDDDAMFVVYEKEDLSLLMKRLMLVIARCDFTKIAQVGKPVVEPD